MGQASTPSEYFNYPDAARRAGISETDLAALEALVRRDHPSDAMMFELRMLRTCRAIEQGFATIQDALRPDQSHAA